MVGLVVGSYRVEGRVLRIGTLSLPCRSRSSTRCVQGAGVRADGLLAVRMGEGVGSWLKLASARAWIVHSRCILVFFVILSF